jgi:hypothetical protein
MPGLWSEIEVTFLIVVAVLHACLHWYYETVTAITCTIDDNFSNVFLFSEIPNNFSTDGISNI